MRLVEAFYGATVPGKHGNIGIRVTPFCWSRDAVKLPHDDRWSAHEVRRTTLLEMDGKLYQIGLVSEADVPVDARPEPTRSFTAPAVQVRF